MSKRMRADELLVRMGLCESRSRAQTSILAGQVWLGTERIVKSSQLIEPEAPLRLETPLRYVGRGGLKIEHFFNHARWQVDGLHALDIGASTGGFTDFLLQRGVSSSTCVDVGHGQLHYKLRADPRVTNLEKLNARKLSAQQLPRSFYQLVVMDLSFISLRKVLQSAWNFLAPGGKLAALVKPQFECLREEADRGKGIIVDPKIHDRVLEEIKQFAFLHLEKSVLIAETPSQPRGNDGNQEFFLGWKKEEDDPKEPE